MVAERQEQYGDEQVRGWVMDVADRLRVKAVVEEVTAEVGPIDVLVNNAAINVVGDVHEIAPDDWDTVIAVNLSAPWYLSALVVLGRRGQPEEVAKVIAFLASDDGSYVTGETVTVSGGFKMRP